MKISKIKKILLLGASIGILTAIIVTPILLLNKTKNENKQNFNLLKNSNIVNGSGGVIFQDEFKNLWAMSSSTIKNVDETRKIIDTKLQVLKANENKNGYVASWSDDNSENGETLLKGSNIIKGDNGVIFQDDFGNLWTMGSGTKLQVFKANSSKDDYDENTGWTDANSGLTKNSNITNGNGGIIFQDEFKNLWAMANNTSLQVLRVNSQKNGYVNTGWNDANNVGLTKGSNIVDGSFGIIFQDEFKNLWAMGDELGLQVLRVNSQKNGYVNTGWNDANNVGLTKGSKIVDGYGGAIFQDEFKNLWAMGDGSKLQVLKANSSKDGYDENTGWTNANSGLTKNSNIANGTNGVIFQDEFKNLWAMGDGTKLQVLKANSSKNGYDENNGWTDANTGLTKNSNISDCYWGVIFQDEFKNLWAMGFKTSLQVLRVNSQKDGYDENTGWTNANSGLTKNSNITNGSGGVIFQDEFKNLWTMGEGTSLQVLKVNENGNGYVNSWQKPNN